MPIYEFFTTFPLYVGESGEKVPQRNSRKHRFFLYSHPPKVFACEYFLANTFYQNAHANTEIRIH